MLPQNLTTYAETDLDQPTNFSLRYTEDDLNSQSEDEKLSSVSGEVPAATTFVHDTTKTYYTEDTPYETPYHFSSATSMTDLNIDQQADGGPSVLDRESTIKKASEKQPSNAEGMLIKSQFSSGLMSPEKPVNYCEEGTPGAFSRADSCGSLNSLSLTELKLDTYSACSEEHSAGKLKVISSKDKALSLKMVKFDKVVNYAEETPLMFSRTSSLESLRSVPDDHSSAVSDVSRLTSGLVSPSELPDSPSQSMPTSPKSSRKSYQTFIRGNPDMTISSKITQKSSLRLAKTHTIASDCLTNDDGGDDVRKSKLKLPYSVFEDAVQNYVIENTPIQFSSATSISNLSCDSDDDDKLDESPREGKNTHKSADTIDGRCSTIDTNTVVIQENRLFSECESKIKCVNGAMRNEAVAVVDNEQQGQSIEQQSTDFQEDNSSLILSDLDENEGQALLAACINIGMKKHQVNINDDVINTTDSNKENENATTENQFHWQSSDDDDAEKALLDACINAGIHSLRHQQASTQTLANQKKAQSLNFDDVDDSTWISSSDDEEILAACIQAGIKNNRRSSNSQIVAVRNKAPVQIETRPDHVLPKDSNTMRQYCRNTPDSSIRKKDWPSVPTNVSRNIPTTHPPRLVYSENALNGVHSRHSHVSNEPQTLRHLSDVEQQMLTECILSGMPRSRRRQKSISHLVSVPAQFATSTRDKSSNNWGSQHISGVSNGRLNNNQKLVFTAQHFVENKAYRSRPNGSLMLLPVQRPSTLVQRFKQITAPLPVQTDTSYEPNNNVNTKECCIHCPHHPSNRQHQTQRIAATSNTGTPHHRNIINRDRYYIINGHNVNNNTAGHYPIGVTSTNRTKQKRQTVNARGEQWI